MNINDTIAVTVMITLYGVVLYILSRNLGP